MSGEVCPGCNNYRSLHAFSTGSSRTPSSFTLYMTCNECRRRNVFAPYNKPVTKAPPAQLPQRTRAVQDNLLVSYILAFVSFLIMISVAILTLPYLYMGEFACNKTTAIWNLTHCDVSSFWGLGDEYRVRSAYVGAYAAFWALFAFRYFRLIVAIFSYFSYKPTPVPANPTYTSRDVTVLIPTVDANEAFYRCMQSIAANLPAKIIIITVGQKMHDEIELATRASGLLEQFPTVDIQVHHTQVANKRGQIDSAIPLIQTRLTSMADATVLWGPRFLISALAPMEDSNVWLVGTNKRVQRSREGGLRASFFNFIGCLYLERHNFDIRSQNAITGEVFVISGRTNVIRTHVIEDPAFRAGYTNEFFFLNKFGPIAADDDNFIVRWILKRGKAIKFQYDDDARIEIAPIGEYPRFFSQCLRWVRTTWRSNPASLKIPHVWLRQPYSVYSIYITSFFNFALFFDALLVYLFCQTPYVTAAGDDWTTSVGMLIAWIICSKMVKLITYFWRQPMDLLFFPGYIAFAYYHSLIKLYASTLR